jgi:argininosuccinate synthase
MRNKILIVYKPEFYERFQGRMDLLQYAERQGIPVTQTKAKPWSTDENMFHISYEAGILEDPAQEPPSDMWKLTRSLQEASPQGPERIQLEFEQGLPVMVRNLSANYQYKDPLQIFECLNQLARMHGIGRIDIVENRYVGIKSRGCYETPAGTVLHKALRDLEGLTMDREVRRLRDEWAAQMCRLIYNGFWFSPERRLLSKSIALCQEFVSGQVTLELYKGNVIIIGRSSLYSLYNQQLSSMDHAGGFNPSHSTGFILTQSIRLKADSVRQNANK